ncbi:NAD-dependent epimerase/dehydratase family protein [Butyrivibrio sp. M55]|uniref:NAD-dependent epimerase/dehydratase family protein n=1 Tax=Butyrivibrio sp. M55 TaxID=1855323 RepID=UPI0008EB5714|nr:NAD-dependent epimerase/dehydratase family protein [Butyrivibrio sp. M55]SFU54530.1 farnesol dehydrogenase [Butyrivibrio sp. M55]
MKVLITGATGFVGGHLVPALIERGYQVKCLVRNEDKARCLKAQFDVETVIGDVTDADSLHGISENIDYVIHLAAMGHVSSVSKEAYNRFTGINEGGTRNLINEFRYSKTLKKFVHFSSTAAMGPVGEVILDEESAPNPVTPYQKSKWRSEQIILDACSEFAFPGVIVRPCMIYGVGGYGEFYKFCKFMKKGVFPKVGLGKNLTPLVHVDDVVNGAILAMENGRNGQAYILASDTSIEMDELHRLIMKNIGKWAPYIYVPVPITLGVVRIIEIVAKVFEKEPIVNCMNIKSTVYDRTFDIKKAKNELGYVVRISFDKGINETINWFKSQGKI